MNEKKRAHLIHARLKSAQCRYILHFSALHRNWFFQLNFHFSINRLHASVAEKGTF